MGVEVERKFLVVGDGWRAAASERIRMRQGYLTREGPSSVRIRLTGDEARLNLKSAEVGTTRLEFDWAVPRADAEQILDRLCHRPLIEKVRHLVRHEGHLWEIDEFEGDNAGLIVAELELGAADEAFARPATAAEQAAAVGFLEAQARLHGANLAEQPRHEAAWTDLAHALVNAKEFIFVP